LKTEEEFIIPNEEPRSDVELHEMIARGEPFSDLPDFFGRNGNWSGADTGFSGFIGVFHDAYEHGSTGEHIAELLAYAAFRNPDMTKLLRVQWRKLCNFNRMRRTPFDLSDDSMEELIAPVARAGCPFRGHPASDSDLIRPPVPI